MRVPSVEGRRRSLGWRAWLIGGVILFVILLLSLRGLARAYTDYLWFKDVGYAHTWRSLLSAKIVPALIFSVIFFVLMLVNLIVADRVAPRYRSASGPEDEIVDRYRGYVAPYAGRVRVGVSLFFALVMGSGVSGQWQNWILFSNSTSFGIKDPQFHKDISFYVFRLPFLQFAAGWVFAALLVVLIVSAIWHYLNGGIRLQSPFQRVTPQVKVHLSVLLALMSLTKTYQYYLAQFALTGSHRGFVDGATYTDVHAQLPALRLLMLISVAAAGLFIVNIWRKGWVFPIIAVGLWGFISIVIGTIVPAVIQRVVVQPNELTREKPYIQRNIDATRAAFNLDTQHVSSQQFGYTSTLKPADAQTNAPTLDNVRLYDPAPATAAFQITQKLLPFYKFSDTDVDRYTIGSETGKPTLVSVRELSQSTLPDNSWTNQHLVYTHGYGVVAAAADEVNGQPGAGSEPSYVLQDIPPTGDLASQIDPKYTGVYFGEGLSGYAVVDTKVAEQEASGNSSTKTTTYTGDAGVPIGNFFRKAALALRFGDWNLFVSGQVTSNSKVLYIRDIRQRVQTLAPFLKYDADPYSVVINGHIVWVIDAYTTTNSYPYSQSISPSDLPNASDLNTTFNYVRNSVKATVDAYTGQVHFYVVDQTDPIIKTYRKAFPELFSDMTPSQLQKDNLSGLQAHLRYPEDVFRAQTDQFNLYHITDPVQFFNKQGIWEVAASPDIGTADNTGTTAPASGGNNGGRNNTLAAGTNPIDPLYLSLQLPKEAQPEFVLERSFTPRTNANLISFMVARSDPAHYGQMVVYNVPDANVPSPAQAASAIESNPQISKAFSLLGTGGSTLDKGTVQLIPMGDTLLYVRPILVTGSSSQTFPRFQYVAVSVGDQQYLAFNMDNAIRAVLTRQVPLEETNAGNPNGSTSGNVGGGPSTTTTTTVPGSTTPPPANSSVSALLAAASREFQLATQAYNNHDLGGYQTHNARGAAYVAQAESKLNAASTTTLPSGTTTTTKPAKTTTSTAAP